MSSSQRVDSKGKIQVHIEKTRRRRLVKYTDLPEYLQDNEYILDYYRCEWSLKDILLSVFSLHNETLNIWTHLGGFFMFVGLTVMSYGLETRQLAGLLTRFSRVAVTRPLMGMMIGNNDSNVSSLDSIFQASNLKHISESSFLNVHKGEVHEVIPRWPWFVFLAGAMCCLACSSVSHLFACHSKCFNLFFWRLDYAGISFMIVCSFFAPVYYAFYCHPYVRFFYLSSITVLGVLAIATLLAPALSSPRFRSFRASLFLAMGFYGIVPAAHAVLVNWGHPQVYMAFGYEFVMGIFYAIGAGFYICRIPEKWKPGAFDIAGHSHQIFHVFVVAGALAHCACTLNLLDHRQKYLSCSA